MLQAKETVIGLGILVFHRSGLNVASAREAVRATESAEQHCKSSANRPTLLPKAYVCRGPVTASERLSVTLLRLYSERLPLLCKHNNNIEYI